MIQIRFIEKLSKDDQVPLIAGLYDSQFLKSTPQRNFQRILIARIHADDSCIKPLPLFLCIQLETVSLVLFPPLTHPICASFLIL